MAGLPNVGDPRFAVLALALDGRQRSVADFGRVLPLSKPAIAAAVTELESCGLLEDASSRRYPRFSFSWRRHAVATAIVAEGSLSLDLYWLDGSSIASLVLAREKGEESTQISSAIANLATQNSVVVLAAVAGANDNSLNAADELFHVERIVHLAAMGEFRRVHPSAKMLYFAYIENGRVERGVVANGQILRGAGGIAGLIDHREVFGIGGTDALGSELGEVIRQDLSLLNPAAVVVSSPDGDRNGELLARIRRAVYAKSAPTLTASLTIAWSTLGNDAPRIGARELAVDHARSVQSIQALLESTRQMNHRSGS